MKRERVLWPLLAVLLLALSWFVGGGMPVSGAPAAAPTPIAQYVANQQAKTVEFWNAASLTADTRSTCFNVAGYNTLDIHYILDQGTTNTTTVSLQFSNVPGSYVTGAAVVTANAADAGDLKEFNVFGSRACLYADVTNSNALSVTAVGLLK